ncbi:Oca4p [Kluyveromyces lactis]|uniref:KLLA0C18777p n=1 Tax=Kluyveromyces lactis (strain ATCC 8585 / CBS 2359 / DSM 70799 / NBRC 1267 / NRRL Y-1140 / WM37) TaxID=284590 RepID=Q6CSQ2_KLULA|nr:uncharacterized protein KLLA0_C18777g [Kluyveromyces lactis]CAH01888.1 KLLA0C18777p [Kluyveromyces lactis]|eukprot:XP_453037.1 uncharacterized protein KLLA0_C18777g [Kluyveromyces lactis]
MLVPPANFGIPEEGIYRCSKLETINLSFLETLNLNTIIFIGGQIPSNFFKEFFATNGIDYFVIKTSGDSSSLVAPDHKKRQSSANHGETRRKSLCDNCHYSYTLTDQDDLMLIKSQSIRRIFRILLDVSYHNVLLVDKTSAVIGILRKIQKWELSSIISEYRLFTGKNKNYFAETFLELIDIRLIQEEEQPNQQESHDTDSSTVTSRMDNLSVEEKQQQEQQQIQTVQESDLSMPPELPQHMMSMIHTMELKPEEDAKEHELPIKHSRSALGIFGNRYRLAFNKRERNEYTYYQASNVKNAFSIGVPTEEALPNWFKFQRDIWDQQHAVEEHNHYKESIFI